MIFDRAHLPGPSSSLSTATPTFSCWHSHPSPRLGPCDGTNMPPKLATSLDRGPSSSSTQHTYGIVVSIDRRHERNQGAYLSVPKCSDEARTSNSACASGSPNLCLIFSGHFLTMVCGSFIFKPRAASNTSKRSACMYLASINDSRKQISRWTQRLTCRSMGRHLEHAQRISTPC